MSIDIEKKLDAIEKKLESILDNSDKVKHSDLINLLDKSSPLFHKNKLSDAFMQKSLVATWKNLQTNNFIFNDFSDVGFRVFSQNDEDGILLYIFTIIGTVNKQFVEIGANCDDSHIGIPENNSTNLIVNHGWNGLILDGSDVNVGQLIHFFASCKDTKHYHWVDRKSRREWESNYFCPIIRQAMVSAENINNLISDANLSGEIDLLSIDVDGMDYWIWDSVNVINPRVVIIEFNNRISLGEDFVIPYEKDYVVNLEKENIWNYNGASIKALIRLAESKGYRLIAINNVGINAFFMRDDVGLNSFKEINETDAFKKPIFSLVKDGDRFNPNKDM